MANPHRKLSLLDVQINGQAMTIAKVTAFELGGFKRESALSDSGVYFKRSQKPFKLTMTIIIREGSKLADFQNIEDATVIVTSDTGQSYTVSNAWVEQADAISGSEGTLTITLAGNPAIEVG